MYYDRIDAGSVLAKELKKYKDDTGVVLAVPRGGVPVAYMIAVEFGFPLDILLTKKIGHPQNSEYAIGAVSLTDRIITNSTGVSPEYIEAETKGIRERLKEMYTKFMGDRKPQSLKGKTVIIVDDGMATGNTLLSVISIIRRSNPKRIVIAVPVASEGAIERLAPVVDEIICPLIPEKFWGVGAFYRDFTQVSDGEVIYYMQKLNELKKAG